MVLTINKLEVGKMLKIKDIIKELEKWAPTAYQEDYDNAGLIVGDASELATGALLTLDVTEQVVDEAVRRGCNLIIAHHPIVFRGLKRFNGNNYVERTVIKAIRAQVAIYAIHTNLDHVSTGVNAMIARKLGLRNLKILAPKRSILKKLTFFCPSDSAQSVLDALFAVGAGRIGNYENCSFSAEGTGSFKPAVGASPVIGKVGEQERVAEHRSEIMFPAFLEGNILQALKEAHPYEEVAYYVHVLENENQEVGAGAVGDLVEPLAPDAFLGMLKQNMELQVVKYTAPANEIIRRVAVCGGAGSFLLNAARTAKADVFVTADYKYHEFFDAENKIMICDIGHYESEVYTKDLLYNYLSGIFSNFALCLSDVNTNPVRYFV